MNFQSAHVAESSTSAIIKFNNSKLDSDTEMLQDSESEMYNQNSDSETITGSEVSISNNNETDDDEIDDFSNDNDDYDDDVYDYNNSSLDFSQANPAVLQSCILSSSVISHPPITRNGETYTLENYLNTFLSPASQLNSSIDNLKDAIYSRTTIYDQDGLPAFPQIDFTEFRMNSSSQIFCKLDFDSFLLNTTDLSIIERPIQFFCFTNRMWNLDHHNHEYWNIEDNNNIIKKVKLVNIPHFQLGQFGELGLFKILIFFPKMYTFGSRKKTFLTDENLASWYDDIFFPSLISQQHSTPDIIHHYPSTFKAYKLKSKKDSGYFFHHAYGLSPAILMNITNSMRSKISSNINLSKFDNFFFHIYAKNLKLYTKI